MAWFDVSAGLAEMGKTVSQTMSVAMLEQMKAANEESRIKLANDLATERESRGRKEAHGYDMEKMEKDQTFKAAEGKADRDNRLATTGMSVGGQLASTRMTIDARREEAELDRKARAAERQADYDFRRTEREADQDFRSAETQKDRDARAQERDKSIEAQLRSHTKTEVRADGTAWRFNPVTGDLAPVLDAEGKPVKFRDPLEARAQTEALATSKEQLNQTIRLYRDELTTAERDLESARKGVLDPTERDKDPSVRAAQKRVDEIRAAYQPKINEYNQRTNALIQYLLKQAGIAAPRGSENGGPSLDDFNRKSSGAAPTTLPASGQGLITFGGR